MELKGSTAVITGASAGIGAAVAEALHAKGANLVLCGQREDVLAERAAKLGNAHFVAGDLVDPGVAQRLIDTALQAYGGCDIVINNAGIMTAGAIDDIDLDLTCRMMRVNIEAGVRVMYTALRHFRKAGRGHLITTGSVLGTKVRPFSGAYSATKYALEALTESFRLELAGTGIRVGIVEPGLTITELHRDWEKTPAQMRGLKEAILPEDVARCVMFMLETPGHVYVPRLMLLPGDDEI